MVQALYKLFTYSKLELAYRNLSFKGGGTVSSRSPLIHPASQHSSSTKRYSIIPTFYHQSIVL